MASPSQQGQDSDVLSPEYMSLLQSLCRLTEPTVNEISGIFNGEFRRALGDGKTKPSKRSEAQSTSRGGPSTSRGAPSRGSKKRGGKSGNDGFVAVTFRWPNKLVYSTGMEREKLVYVSAR